ncbi:MAG: hypothetical protein K2Y23_21705 [Cyanobacteria bacterium]|nr:hypothetical protein [Cyanobacteriota bacterium]
MSDPRFDRDDEPMPAWRGRSTWTVSVGVHAAVAVAWLLLLAWPPAVTGPAAAPMIEVARVVLPPPEDPRLFTERAIPPEELSGYDISGLPFNLPKIDARRAALFPFLTADLSFIDRLATDLRASSAKLKNPLDQARHAKPLLLAASLRQQIIDEAWARRDRWKQFGQIRALLVGHDGNAGDAAALMRAYLDQNLLQPYCDGRLKDGQFWALLENSTEYVDFLDFIRSYSRTRSSSRTTTELLFLMDALAQGNREVAQTVLNTNISHDLTHTATISPRAALLAANIGNDLRSWVASHGYGQRLGVGQAVDDVRLRILSSIIATTPDGYRESDARYLAGEILFKQGSLDEALRWWAPMQPREGDTYIDARNQSSPFCSPGALTSARCAA